jgi:hypothetical protein
MTKESLKMKTQNAWYGAVLTLHGVNPVNEGEAVNAAGPQRCGLHDHDARHRRSDGPQRAPSRSGEEVIGLAPHKVARLGWVTV